MDEQQALGGPYEIEWRGKTLRFSPISQTVKAKCVSAGKLAAKLEHDENMALLYSGNDPLTMQARQQDEQSFRDGMMTGRWQWSGDLQRTWRNQAGVYVFIGALLEAGGTPLTKDEINELANEKQQEIFAVVALSDWDITNPKTQRSEVMKAIAAGLSRSPTSTQSSPASHTGSE